jgi:hypothetical protein
MANARDVAFDRSYTLPQGWDLLSSKRFRVLLVKYTPKARLALRNARHLRQNRKDARDCRSRRCALVAKAQFGAPTKVATAIAAKAQTCSQNNAMCNFKDRKFDQSAGLEEGWADLHYTVFRSWLSEFSAPKQALMRAERRKRQLRRSVISARARDQGWIDYGKKLAP